MRKLVTRGAWFLLAACAAAPLLAQDDDDDDGAAAPTVPAAWKLDGGARLRVEWTIERTESKREVGQPEEKRQERRKVVMDWVAPAEGIAGKGALEVQVVRVEWSLTGDGIDSNLVLEDGELKEEKLERQGGEPTDRDVDAMILREAALGYTYRVELAPAKGSIGIQPSFTALRADEQGNTVPAPDAGLFAPLGHRPAGDPYLHPPLPPGGLKKGQKLSDPRFLEQPGVTRADAEGIAIGLSEKIPLGGGGGGSGPDGAFNFEVEGETTAELAVELAKGRPVSVKLVEGRRHHETPAKKDPGSFKENEQVTRIEQTWSFR